MGMTNTRNNIMRQCYDSMMELVRPEHGKDAPHTFESDMESRVDEMEDVDELISGSEHSGNSSDDDSGAIHSTTRSSAFQGKKRRWAFTNLTASTSKRPLYASPKSIKISSQSNRKFSKRTVLGTGSK